MIARQSIAALTAALVHPQAMASSLERSRHQIFILRTLSFVFAALAVAPFFLAFHGAPSLTQTLLFSFCLVPLGAVMLVSKTGHLGLGHTICVGCLVGAGITLALSRELGLGCAVAWLIVAQTESLLSFERRLVVGTALVSTLVVAGLGTIAGWLTTGAFTPGSDVLVGLALGYAVINALAIVHLQTRRQILDRDKAARVAAIADTIDDLVVSYDAQGTVDFVGRTCERLFAVPAQDLMGRGLFERIHVADRPIFLKAIGDAAHGTDTVVASFRLKTVEPETRRDGGHDVVFLWVEMRARRLEGDAIDKRLGSTRTDPARGVISLLRNVSANKRLESEVEAARLAAERIGQSQNHFLANMSHELRTPLNAIIGFSEMLGSPTLRPSDTAKQSEYARIIHQSGQHLLAVVNSILDMSKIQSGTFSIAPEAFDIGPLIDSCCEIVTLNAQEGRVEIVRAEVGTIDLLVADRRACKQILINLLSNAVKFTPANGCVRIEAKPEGTSLLIRVADTGIGIGASDLARLGDPFFQVKSAFDRPYEGTGLGLSVVRGLVGLHGGAIAIESEPGHGTSVTIRLPLDCRFAADVTCSAKIETIARRGSLDPVSPAPFDIKVKKIA